MSHFFEIFLFNIIRPFTKLRKTNPYNFRLLYKLLSVEFSASTRLCMPKCFEKSKKWLTGPDSPLYKSSCIMLRTKKLKQQRSTGLHLCLFTRLVYYRQCQGRRHAGFFSYISLFFFRSIANSPFSSSSSAIFPNCSSPKKSASV